MSEKQKMYHRRLMKMLASLGIKRIPPAKQPQEKPQPEPEKPAPKPKKILRTTLFD